MSVFNRIKDLSLLKKIILGLMTSVLILDVFFFFKISFFADRSPFNKTDEYDYSYEEQDLYNEEFVYDSTNEADGIKVVFVNEEELLLEEMLSIYKSYDPMEVGAFDPSSIKFDHEEVYKGIRIGWTNDAPINAERLVWLKEVIDLLPQDFLEKYPVEGFYSAAEDDYPDEWYGLSNASAFASGSNIYLMPVMASEYLPDLYEQYTKDIFAGIIYHEWAHVIQFYDMFYTFEKDYLDHLVDEGISLSSYMMQSSNLVFDFATKVGWVYDYDDFDESVEKGFCLDYTFCPYYYANYANKPSGDDDFLKTTDYALESYTTGGIEDMAETFSYFVICDKSVEFSSSRIEWVEEFLGNSQEYYCGLNLF